MKVNAPAYIGALFVILWWRSCAVIFRFGQLVLLDKVIISCVGSQPNATGFGRRSNPLGSMVAPFGSPGKRRRYKLRHFSSSVVPTSKRFFNSSSCFGVIHSGS